MKYKSKLKRDNRLTKGKLLGIGALLFSMGVVTSITSTFAYFNLTQIGIISNLNLSINLDDAYLELWLSKDKNKTLDQLTEGIDLIHREDGYTKEDLGIEGIILNDVSGMNQNKWYHNGQALTDPLALPRLSTAPRAFKDHRDPGYEESDIYVQNVFYLKSNYDCTVYLDGSKNTETGLDTTFIRANETMNHNTAIEKGLDENKLNQVVHSVRVSFLSEDKYIIAKPLEDPTTEYAGVLDLDVDGYYDYDNDDKEILYGEYEGTPSYEVETNQNDKYKDGNVFISNHKPGVSKVKTSSLNIKKEEAVTLDSLRYDPNDAFKDLHSICTLNKDEMKRIVVSIYIEGWDKYMTDDIASASFDIALSFTAVLDR